MTGDGRRVLLHHVGAFLVLRAAYRPTLETDVGGNPCASAYAPVRADCCARDRNLAYAPNARGRVGSVRA